MHIYITVSLTIEEAGVCNEPIAPTAQLGVRDYVRRLEGSVITALGQFGVQGFTTENVGVWVRAHDNHEKKICALG